MKILKIDFNRFWNQWWMGNNVRRYTEMIVLHNFELSPKHRKHKILSFINDCIKFTRIFNGELITCYFNFGNNNSEVSLKGDERILLGTLM